MNIKSFLISFFYLFLGFQLIGCNTSDPKIDDDLALIPCQNGLADTYSCNNVDLYAHVPLSELLIESGNRLNDIWGWQDEETGKEYALVGLTDGVTFVDVTNPVEPVVVGKLMEPAGVQKRPAGLMSNHDEEDFKGESNWRDLKVYENTLYVVSEQNGHGMQVFDLTQLLDINEDNAPVIFEDIPSNRYTQFDNAHNLAINEETGFAYIVGITSGTVCAERGGLHMVDLNDPLNPEFAGCYYDEEAGHRNPKGYIHDTQCVIYNGPDSDYSGHEICFNSAENSLLITDVDEKLLASTISITFYEGNTYSHQGWLTEDQRYFMMNDELDERNYHHTTRTYIWDVEDLDNPVMTGYYDHGTTSVDHNLYIVDDMMYHANYTSGLRVLDVSNPTPDGIVEMGFFDTTPGPDNLNFGGLWSVYPWLSGDTIIASDIENGLFIFRVER